jgi:hypothetical protein
VLQVQHNGFKVSTDAAAGTEGGGGDGWKTAAHLVHLHACLIVVVPKSQDDAAVLLLQGDGMAM